MWINETALCQIVPAMWNWLHHFTANASSLRQSFFTTWCNNTTDYEIILLKWDKISSAWLKRFPHNVLQVCSLLPMKTQRWTHSTSLWVLHFNYWAHLDEYCVHNKKKQNLWLGVVKRVCTIDAEEFHMWLVNCCLSHKTPLKCIQMCACNVTRSGNVEEICLQDSTLCKHYFRSHIPFHGKDFSRLMSHAANQKCF